MRRLLSVDEAAAYLSISTWHVHDLLNNGKIPHVRIGKRKLIDIRDLEEFVRKNKEGGDGETKGP